MRDESNVDLPLGLPARILSTVRVGGAIYVRDRWLRIFLQVADTMRMEFKITRTRRGQQWLQQMKRTV